MLKLTLAVQSGVKEIVPCKTKAGKSQGYEKKFQLAHNTDNEHLFNNGLLLRLMGEKFSQYAMQCIESITQPTKKLKKGELQPTTIKLTERQELDCEVIEQYKKVSDFLSKLETKHIINTDAVSYNMQTYEQASNSFFVHYPSYVTDNTTLSKFSDDNPRFDPYYSDIITNDGILDSYLIESSELAKLCVSSDKQQTIHAAKEILQTLDLDQPMISIQESTRVSDALANIFVVKADPNLLTRRFSDVYTHIMSDYETNKGCKQLVTGLLKKESLKDNEVKQLREIEQHTVDHQVRTLYFIYKFLSCEKKYAVYKGLPDDAEFRCDGGLFNMKAEFDFTQSSKIKGVLDWIDDITCMPTGSAALNSHGNFKIAIFNKGRCKVASKNPVTTVKYDGTLDLYVKTDEDTQHFIMNRIKDSQVWRLRTGKMCIADLVSIDEVPDYYFDNLIEEEEF